MSRKQQLCWIASAVSAVNIAVTLGRIGGGAFGSSFIHTWQFNAVSGVAIVAGIACAASLLRRIRRNREVSR